MAEGRQEVVSLFEEFGVTLDKGDYVQRLILLKLMSSREFIDEPRRALAFLQHRPLTMSTAMYPQGTGNSRTPGIASIYRKRNELLF